MRDKLNEAERKLAELTSRELELENAKRDLEQKLATSDQTNRQLRDDLEDVRTESDKEIQVSHHALLCCFEIRSKKD